MKEQEARFHGCSLKAGFGRRFGCKGQTRRLQRGQRWEAVGSPKTSSNYYFQMIFWQMMIVTMVVLEVAVDGSDTAIAVFAISEEETSNPISNYM